MANILQVSEDGTNWFPVCDDEFDDKGAIVACREMGFARVNAFASVRVAGSRDFGMDELECTGTEASLFDCPRSGWRQHDCADTEHVQLTCRN